MPNKYDSQYTGLHNDGYEPRIKTLEDLDLNNRISNIESEITDTSTTATQQLLINRIIALEQQVANLQANLSNYLPLSGGTLTGTLVISNGGNLMLNAPSGSLDSGDIVFADSAGTEKGRLYTASAAAANLYYRPSASHGGIIINNESMVPSNNVISISRSISNNSSNWRAFMSSYTAPSNGYIQAYFTGVSNTPSFYFAVNGSCQYRGNGNGSRDVCAIMPVRKGQVVTGECVYCYPSWIQFVRAQEGQV